MFGLIAGKMQKLDEINMDSIGIHVWLLSGLYCFCKHRDDRTNCF